MRIINSVLDEVYVCFFDLDEDGGTSKTASHGPDRAATGEWVEDDAWNRVADVVASRTEPDGLECANLLFPVIGDFLIRGSVRCGEYSRFRVQDSFLRVSHSNVHRRRFLLHDSLPWRPTRRAAPP